MYGKSFKNKIVIFIPVLILVIVGTYLGFFSKQTAAWYEPGSGTWTYRVAITVNSSEVDVDLTDFPVYVDLSDLPVEFHTNVKTDGGDIRVTTADGTTEIPREVVIYDAGTDTGELHFKASTVSSTVGTTFYIYYGNGAASDYTIDATYGAENVWTNGYEGVWHMQQDPSGSAPQILDSTSNQNHGTSSGSMTTGDVMDGRVGKAIDFDGSNDYIGLGSVVALVDSLTISFWGKLDSASRSFGINNYGGLGPNNHLALGYDISAGGSYNWFVDNGSDSFAVESGVATTGAFYFLTSTYDHTNNEASMFLDGVLKNTTVLSGADPDWQQRTFHFAKRRDGNTLFWDGLLDEIRLSNGRRTDAWIDAEYNNQNSPSTFYTLGTEEENVVTPTVTTGAVTSIGTTTATGNGNVTADGGATVTERGVVWNTSTAPTTANSSATSAGTTGAFTASMTGLSPSTLYYVRAYAINSEGTSYGSEVSFTTDADGGGGGGATSTVPSRMPGGIRLQGGVRVE